MQTYIKALVSETALFTFYRHSRKGLIYREEIYL